MNIEQLHLTKALPRLCESSIWKSDEWAVGSLGGPARPLMVAALTSSDWDISSSQLLSSHFQFNLTDGDRDGYSCQS